MNILNLTFLTIISMFSLGIFNILLALLKSPTKKSNKHLINVINKNKTKVDISELIVTEIASKLYKYIKINSFNRKKLVRVLGSAKITYTPEMYIARAIAKSLIIFSFSIPIYFIIPVITPIIFVLSINVYFNEIKNAENIMKKNIAVIESELPRFANTISQELHTTRDPLIIFENFSRSTEGIFRKELEITIADMRIGNVKNALLNMDKRINSSMLSEILRGMIGCANGDDNIVYFKLLAMKLKEIELLKLKGEANKRPDKIKKYSLVLLITFISIFLVSMMLQLFDSMNKLF